MKPYRLDPVAQADLNQIFDHIAEHNLSAADRVIDRLTARFALLARNPLMGQLRPDLDPELRSFSVGKYVIFFRPIAGGIQVVRILHSAQDVNAQFRGPTT